MASFNLNVNASATFDSLAEARMVGQAIDRLLGDGKRGGAQLQSLTHEYTPLYAPVFDRSKVVVGFQEAEAKATGIAKEIEKLATPEQVTEMSSTDFWAGFIAASKGAGEVDLVALSALVSVRTGDVNAQPLITAAYATIAGNEVNRALGSIASAAAGAAKRAAHLARQGQGK